MRRTWKSFLSLLLAFAMILSLGTAGFALDDETEAAAPAEEVVEEAGGTGVELPFEKVDNDIISERLPLANQEVEEEEPTYADDELVRVSIVLNGASALDAGYAPASAGAYRAGLLAEQQAMASKISAEALGGAQLDVVWNLTLAANIISAYVPYGAIEDVRNVIGVKDVVIELRYFPTADEVDNATATEMTGATEAWNLGYTGAGSTIAIVDTGLDIEHKSFDPAAFEYAIDELNETRETPVDLMTADDVAAVWDQLNAATFLDLDGVYRSAKVPFGVNYVDMDYDITHINDTQGEHGSHVAGIAAANKYVPNGDGFEKALQSVMTQGEAPDAQLLIMKVFGKGGGAYDSDYMSAIEDAMTLGCDSVNLSLGSSVAGYTTNDTYAETLNKLTGFGLVWANSAGNNYSWSNDSTGANYLYADDVNYQTGGSPATYHNSLSVASVDNKGAVGYTVTASDGTPIFYTETNGYGNAPMSSIPGEYSYIMIPGPGVADNDYSDNMFAALGSEILEGKIGICFRGSSSFFAKANAAAEQGTAAVIIANNQAGTINMNLTGYEYSVPAVSITQNDGYLLMGLGEEKEANGVTYYEGTLTVNDSLSVSNVGTPTTPVQTMSDFSSWGGNGALTMKPEITAPGGGIWSVWGANNGTSSPTSVHDAYENMSGTSMASPQVAGVVAVLKQYIRESGLAEKFPNLTERAIAQSLLMSTSMPLTDEYGDYWSIMKQGSGLVDVNSAIIARSLIQVIGLPGSAPASAYDSIADGKVKVELGEVDSGFGASFTVTNFSDEAMSLYLNGELFTQWIYGGSFRTEYTTPVYANFSWAVNGEDYSPANLGLDFNNDGVSNSVDAQLLLQWCADESTEIYNLEYADLDGDGNVDTADAKIAFETLNGAAIELAAGETAVISAYVNYDMSEYDDFNGNYVEGFLYVREGETNDGALGVEHSIPVFGYNGDYSAATMFDRGSRLEYKYGFGDGDEETGLYPYMYYTDPSAGGLGDNALNQETFLVKYAGDNGTYYFGGNPLIDDETYHPERNALNAGDTLAGVRFTQIRNSGASRFYVTDKYDRVVKGTEMLGGPGYAVYYYRNQATWQQSSTTASFNYIPRTVKEGDELTAHYQLALEYYIEPDGTVRWEDLGEGSELSIPFVIDNTAPDIVSVYRDSSAAPEQDDYELPIEDPTAIPNEGEDAPVTDEPTEPAEEETATDTLEITTHDNQYIAAVALFTDEGELLDAKGAVEDTIRGKEVYYSFDLKALFGEEEVYPYLLVQVYDYASNLSTYKVNLVDDLTNAEVESVTLNTNEAVIIGTGSIRLSADVRPWGIDDAVTWTSDNEAVAVVDDNGLVTGVTEGTAIITAASALDPTKSDSCEVTVKFINKELSGIVWDENGEVWFADFNLNSLPNYEKLNASNLRLALSSAAYDENGVLYAADFDSDAWTSNLYTVNTEDWSVEMIGGSSEVGYMDICQAPSLGDNHLLAIYGTYVLIVDKTTGDYEGAFNLASSTNGNYLVGIAYEEQYNHPSYGNTDWVFLLDSAGNIYSAGYLPYNGSYATFGASNMGNLGYSCDLDYWQSFYYDGASLFWSCFNQASNKVDIIMVDDLYNDGSIYMAGSFADGVWPVGGLFENGINPYFGEIAKADHSDAVIDPNGTFLTEIQPINGRAPVQTPDEEPIDDEEEGTIEGIDDNEGEIGGTLTAARVEAIAPAAEQDKVDTMVTVVISADELSYNGKIEVNFDPTTAKLVRAVADTQYTGILDRSQDLGRYVLAWVDLEGIETDAPILTLLFEQGSTGTVSITTWEENFKDSDTEQGGLPREEIVYLGSSSVPADHEHEFTEISWNWAEDFSSAIARFTCPKDGVTKSVEAVVTKEVVDATCTETGLNTYTATAEFEGQTYTDVQEVEIEALGHEYGEPEWTWNEDFTASALFTCVRGDDEQEVTATVTSETTAPTCEEAGKTVYTASVEFEGETYTDVKEVEIEATGHVWGEPTWTWDGIKAAEATFVCKTDETHTTTLKAEISTESADGNVTCTATVELDGKTFTDTKTAAVDVTVASSTLTLGDTFAVRIYIKPSEELLADDGAYVTMNDKKIPLSEGMKKGSGDETRYGFSYDIGPTTLNDDVTLKVFDGEGNEMILLKKDGTVLPDGYIYRAQTYIDRNASSSNEKLGNLLKALNDLGNYAQTFFQYNTENIAPLMGDISGVSAADVADYAVVTEVLNEDMIGYIGSTMLLQTELKIRQYYSLADGVDASTLTFTIDGVQVSPKVNGKTVTVDSRNVPARDFDKTYTFEVKDAEGNVILRSQYGVYSYVNAAFEKAADNEALMNLAKALFVYGNAAKTYFGQ